ncbi:hypothetical protein BGX27_009584 [Mortierella sp. AM989]|nr:hypothetical protein BGX27_009584 [Mortierella sp. AM989]
MDRYVSSSDLHRRKLRPRRSPSESTRHNISTIYQDTVFAIPELLDLVTKYLAKNDLRILIRVCRTWNAYWVPYLYSSLHFIKYRRTRVYPKLTTYGQHVKSVAVSYTRKNDIIHILNYATNIQSLSIHSKLTGSEHSEIIAMVPQLRVLQLSCISTPYDSIIGLAATLSNLEEFTWKENIMHQKQQRIDDILHVVKSCRNLRRLVLSCVIIVEELQNANSTISQEGLDMIKVEESGWENTSLQSIECENIILGKLQSSQVGLEHVHPCIRRLFQHSPNLTTIKVTGECNLTALDWKYIFKGRSKVQRAEIWTISRSHFFSSKPFIAMEARGALEVLETLENSCHDLRVLDVRNIRPTTDEAFERVVRVNRQLQKVCAKSTKFGELALRALAWLPPVPELPHSLVELDLEGCFDIKSNGLALVLENCALLRILNVAGTTAGTIDLFRGNKPWVCAKSLERLSIDIQPLDLQEVNRTEAAPYSEEEENMIRDRLHCFASLLELSLKGQAMTIRIVQDLSFAPRLQKVLLSIPYLFRDEPNQSFGSYREARFLTEKWAKECFSDWVVYANPGFQECHISALKEL